MEREAWAVAMPATSSEAESATLRAAGWPLMTATVGGWPWGNSMVRRRREARAGEAELVPAHLVEDARAIAEQGGDGRYGVPDDVAEAAQAGEGGVDGVPVGVEGEVLWGADGEEALGVGLDDAGVGGVDLEGCAGRERSGEGDDGFMELAGVVDVGVEGGLLERSVVEFRIRAGDADLLPIERRGELQGEMGKGRGAFIADGEDGADGDVVAGGAEVNVEVEGGVSDGEALGVGGGERCSGLGLRGGRRGLRRGVAVLIRGTGEDDLTLWRGARGRGRGGLGLFGDRKRRGGGLRVSRNARQGCGYKPEGKDNFMNRDLSVSFEV